MTRFYSATAQPTTLSAACTNSATQIQVTATTGFPAVEFILALDYGWAAQELVKVTNVAGTTLTVVRGFDSTTAQAHSLGAAVTHVHSADDFRLSRTHEAASSGIHGATGALVGTTDAQALSNKDLTAGTNTFPTSLATAANLTAHTGATAAHGATGAVVGTTNAQTLTNKSVDLTSNTLSGTTAQFNAALSDNDFATLAGSETLSNKTLTSPAVTSPSAGSDTTGDYIGGFRFIDKTADESVVSSTVMQNDDQLFFTVVANGKYVIDYKFVGTDAGVGGALASQLVFPSGTAAVASPPAASPVTVTSGGFTSGTIRLSVGATPGTVNLQWAQSSSNATPVVLKAGSYLLVTRVA